MVDMGEEFTHESFGKITVHRTSGHATLFQSPHKHQHYITVRVHAAKMYRNLSQDWVHEDGRLPYIEVCMSEAQWAHFVASAGMGMGTPCTIKAVRDGEYHRCEDPPQREAFRETYSKEMVERGQKAIAEVDKAADMLRELMKPGAKINKSSVQAVLNALTVAQREAGPNLGFVMSQFEEALDANLNAAKTELEAHGLAVLSELGLAAIAKKITPEREQKLLETVLGKDEP